MPGKVLRANQIAKCYGVTHSMASSNVLNTPISETFWSRKSAEWEAELQTVDAERARLEATHPPAAVTAEKILELAKRAEILYKSQNPGEQRRLLENSAFELHV